MKIKIIYAPRLYKADEFGYQKQPPYIPPLGLCTLTSFLKKHGYQIEQDDLDIKTFQDNKKFQNNKKSSHSDNKLVNMELFDDRKRIAQFMKTENDTELEEHASRILKKTQYEGFDIIGFSISDDHNFSAIGSIIVLSKLIKEQTGATIIIGGVRHQRRIFEKELTELKYIDFVVLQNHMTALNLLKALECGVLEKKKIKDIAYDKNCVKKYQRFIKKESGKNFRHFESKKADDIIPPPDFSGLPLDLYTPSFDDFRSKELKIKGRVLMLPFSFMNGCLQGCAFCPNSERPFLTLRNPENIAYDLKNISKKYKTRYFLFLNTNVNPSYQYAERLADALIDIDANIMWSDCANLKQLDTKLIQKLKNAGATRLVFGLESASPKMLKFIGKGITQQHAEKMLRETDNAGIWNELELIAGMPQENEKDVKQTVSFIQRNKKYINYFYLAKYMLMNSKMSRYPKQFGITNIKDNIGSLDKIQPYNRRFDEINGLKWNEKVRQIEDSYTQMCRAISDTSKPEQWTNQKGFDSQGEVLHLLFHLYSTLKNKSEVVEYFKRYSITE